MAILPHLLDLLAREHRSARKDVIEIIGLRDKRKRRREGRRGTLDSGWKNGHGSAPEKRKKEARSNACLAASDISGESEGEK
jgi:hypothetical protein